MYIISDLIAIFFMRLNRFLFRKYLEEDEQIHEVIHHHLDSILKPFAINFLLLICGPLAGFMFVPNLSFIWLAIMLIGSIRLSTKIYTWYFNALLVTNQNIINIEWDGLFRMLSERVDYSQIETVSYEIAGVFNTLNNIGTIIIVKLSGNAREIYGVYNPKKAAHLLMEFQEKFAKSNLYKEHENLKSMLSKVLQRHINETGVTIIED